MDSDVPGPWLTRLRCSSRWLHSNTLYTARLLEGWKTWTRLSAAGRWQGKSAAGCCKHAGWRDNPCFLLTLTEEARLLVTLSQPDPRGCAAARSTATAARSTAAAARSTAAAARSTAAAAAPSAVPPVAPSPVASADPASAAAAVHTPPTAPSIGYMVVRRAALRSAGSVRRSEMVLRGMPFRAERDVGSDVGEVCVPRGEYIIVPFTFENGRETAFRIEVHSDSRACTLDALPSVHDAILASPPSGAAATTATATTATATTATATAAAAAAAAASHPSISRDSPTAPIAATSGDSGVAAAFDDDDDDDGGDSDDGDDAYGGGGGGLWQERSDAVDVERDAAARAVVLQTEPSRAERAALRRARQLDAAYMQHQREELSRGWRAELAFADDDASLRALQLQYANLGMESGEVAAGRVGGGAGGVSVVGGVMGGGGDRGWGGRSGGRTALADRDRGRERGGRIEWRAGSDGHAGCTQATAASTAASASAAASATAARRGGPPPPPDGDASTGTLLVGAGDGHLESSLARAARLSAEAHPASEPSQRTTRQGRRAGVTLQGAATGAVPRPTPTISTVGAGASRSTLSGDAERPLALRVFEATTSLGEPRTGAFEQRQQTVGLVRSAAARMLETTPTTQAEPRPGRPRPRSAAPPSTRAGGLDARQLGKLHDAQRDILTALGLDAARNNSSHMAGRGGSVFERPQPRPQGSTADRHGGAPRAEWRGAVLGDKLLEAQRRRDEVLDTLLAHHKATGPWR